jgi:hypothetical protein
LTQFDSIKKDYSRYQKQKFLSNEIIQLGRLRNRLIILNILFYGVVNIIIYGIFYVLNQQFGQLPLQIIILSIVTFTLIINQSKSPELLIDDLNDYLGGLNLNTFPGITFLVKNLLASYNFFYKHIYDDILEQCESIEDKITKDCVEKEERKIPLRENILRMEYAHCSSEDEQLNEIITDINTRIRRLGINNEQLSRRLSGEFGQLLEKTLTYNTQDKIHYCLDFRLNKSL